MRHRLNKKLLGWTLAGLLAAGAGLHTLHHHQVQANAGELLREAGRAAERGDHARAVTYFSHYLAYEPDDIEALTHYAQSLERLPPTPPARRRALEVLEQALRQDPARSELRLRVVRLATGLGRYADAARHLEALAKALPRRSDVEHQLGWCQEALKEYDLAEASLRRAVRKDPAQLDSYALLAELLQSRLQRPDDAAQVMEEMVGANPRSARALLLRARYHRARGAPERGAEDTRQATVLAPRDPDVLLAAAEEAVRQGDLARARTDLAHGLKLYPRDARFYRALAAVEVKAGRPPAAIAYLRCALQALPAEGGLVPVLADLLIDEGRLAEVAALTDGLSKGRQASGVPDYLRARTLVRRGRWAEACDLLEKVRWRPGTQDWAVQIEISLGQCYGHLGETDASLLAFRKAVALDPTQPLARLGLGASLLAAGNVEDAVRELRAVADGDAPPAQVWPVLARALLARNLRLPEGDRDWDALEQALGRAEKGAPDDPEVAILRAEVLSARAAPERARALLEVARAARPNEIRFRTALADLARREGKIEQAREILDQARRDLGDSLGLRLARLRLAASLGPREAAPALEQLGREPLDELSKAGRLRFRRELAEALARAGDVPAAERLWRALASDRPNDLQSRVALFDLALRAGQDRPAREILAEVRKLEGEGGIVWRAGEVARRLALARRGDRSGLAEARKLLAEAKELRRDWPRLCVLEAAADELEGKATAADHYQRALELGERDPDVAARAARLLYERRRFAEADLAFRTLEGQGPLSPELAHLGADIALAQQGGAKRALDLARRAVPAGTRDYREFLWLARVEAAAGKDAEAEKTLRHAARVAGGIPDVWVALVAHLARTGQASRAEEALREAAKRLPPDRAELALARCEEALGRPAQAEAHYRKAVAARPADFVPLSLLADFYRRNDEPAKADPCLRKLIDPATRAPEEYVVRARRELAVGVAARGGPDALTEALALLARNEEAVGRDSADDVARAFVLATRPERREEALKLLERLGDVQALAPDEQFLAARAYEAAGDGGQARDILLRLLTTQGDDARLLACRARGLIREGELEEARLYLARLERLEPQSPRLRALREALSKAEAPPKGNP